MSDIISARCFGCGHTIKVPAGLGGKKARCPQCTNTINIPNPNDTQAEGIVSDADLPEVAVDSKKFVPEEGDAPHPDAVQEPPVEDPSEARRRSSGTGVRRAVSANVATGSHPRVQRSGTQPRYTGQGGPAGKKAAPPASNQGMIIGIVLGVVALLIIGFVVVNKGGSKPPPQQQTKSKEKEKEKEREGTSRAAQYSPEDQALVSRTLDYAAAVNRGDATSVFRFYTYDPEEERKVRIRATEIVDQKVMYDNPQVTSVSSANGSVTFSYGGGKTKSLQWKQVDNVWMIAEKPTP
jgi:hypothetical protein